MTKLPVGPQLRPASTTPATAYWRRRFAAARRLREVSGELPTCLGGDRAVARRLGILEPGISGRDGGIFAPAIHCLQEILDWLRQLPCSEPAGRAVKALDHSETGDLASEEGIQELGIIAEGHAPVRLAVRTQHVGVGEDTGTAVHPAVVDRVEADRAHAVKHPLAQREIVEIRRRRPMHPDVHVAWIVHEASKAGVGLEAAATRQVHGARRDVIDRDAAVILQRGSLLAWLNQPNE